MPVVTSIMVGSTPTTLPPTPSHPATYTTTLRDTPWMLTRGEALDGGPQVFVLRRQAVAPRRRHHQLLQEEALHGVRHRVGRVVEVQDGGGAAWGRRATAGHSGDVRRRGTTASGHGWSGWLQGKDVRLGIALRGSSQVGGVEWVLRTPRGRTWLQAVSHQDTGRADEHPHAWPPSWRRSNPHGPGQPGVPTPVTPGCSWPLQLPPFP